LPTGYSIPSEVHILTVAFDDAWAKLQASRAVFADTSGAREILAKQIIMAAQRGERNPKHLAQDSLLLFSQQKLKPAASRSIGTATTWAMDLPSPLRRRVN
jgi:hypothetical protein